MDKYLLQLLDAPVLHIGICGLIVSRNLLRGRE